MEYATVFVWVKVLLNVQYCTQIIIFINDFYQAFCMRYLSR